MARKDRTGEEIEDPDDATDIEHSGKVLPFSPAEAMEISVTGARLTREIALLIKREEKHVQIVTKCREDRKAKIRELIQLWEDHQKGQQRLEFPDRSKAADAGDAAAPDGSDVEDDAATSWWMIHKDRRVVCAKLAEGSWAALVDGRLVGDGMSCASDAKEFVLGDLGVERQLWPSITWTAGQPPADAPVVLGFAAKFELEGLASPVTCRVWKDDKSWRASVACGGTGTVVDAGEHPSKAKAQRACVQEAERQYEGASIPKLDWKDESEGEPAPAAPIDAAAAEPASVQYCARVGRKSAAIRQEEGPGKWTGRIGGTPIAIGLPLDEAKRLCSLELTKNKANAEVEWVRTEEEDVLP